MEMDELLRIKAIGNLLQYYQSDLQHILSFQRCRQNAISRSDDLPRSAGSSRSFYCKAACLCDLPSLEAAVKEAGRQTRQADAKTRARILREILGRQK
jgi:hypothetical protein